MQTRAGIQVDTCCPLQVNVNPEACYRLLYCLHESSQTLDPTEMFEIIVLKKIGHSVNNSNVSST